MPPPKTPTKTVDPLKDKKTWGPGPWQSEPDEARWRFGGLCCHILRSNVTGGLCGYVGVPKGHPWFGKDYNEIDVIVHGGLTYGDEHKDGLWWIGFDCAHFMDINPKIDSTLELIRKVRQGVLPSRRRRLPGERYRTFDYVKREVWSLARQAKEAKASAR